MELTMSKAIWNAFIDISIMATFLVFAQYLRANVKILQKLLIPPALIAGFLTLLVGPKGLGIVPLSSGIGTYAAVLIVIVFAATPIGDRPSKEEMSGSVIGGMFFNITGICVLQYAAGMLVTVYGLCKFYPQLPQEFGLLMATGFYGGHGTAVAVGNVLEGMGIENMTDIANTFATIGIVGGILLGMVIINWGARKNYTHYVTDPKDLPIEFRTGIIPVEKQRPAGRVTISSISVDPLAFHVGIVLIASIAGYYMTKIIEVMTANMGYEISIPAFCTALLCGFVINMILNKTNAHKYIDRHSIQRVQGGATDFLMISGIGSLNLAVVMDYAVPIIVLSLVGFGCCWFWFMIVGAKTSSFDWFERNMMTWGHGTGVVATGVLLSRTVDPDMKSRSIEDTGLADLYNRPLVIGLQVVPPMIMSMMAGGAHIVTWGIFAILAVMWILAWKSGWWVPSRKPMVYKESTKSKVA
ncbi:MAG: sodium/glutamate symporter [Proteocatella sp.]